jgi:hypothetical protein
MQQSSQIHSGCLDFRKGTLNLVEYFDVFCQIFTVSNLRVGAREAGRTLKQLLGQIMADKAMV